MSWHDVPSLGRGCVDVAVEAIGEEAAGFDSDACGAAVDDVEHLIGGAGVGDGVGESAATMVLVLTVVSAAIMLPLAALILPRRAETALTLVSAEV